MRCTFCWEYGHSVSGCPLVEGACKRVMKWQGLRCYEAWPVSRFAWCNNCSEQKPRQIEVRRVKVAS